IYQTRDKYAYRLNTMPEYYYEKVYGQIEYYFLHNFEDKEYMLAYIKVCSNVITNDQLDFKYFTRFKFHEFIDVQIIDHCVGFFHLGSQYFIIDRENEVDD
ncbi:2268_t:CDS:1, partial [Diversispora eburnea]